MKQDQDVVLMLSIKRFYGQPDNIRPVVAIIRKTSDVSLRLIDWFITSYAKRHNAISVRGDAQYNIYNSYRSALRSFSKQRFDPFRRHQRIKFVYGEGGDEAIETTIAQLNFFKWAIETGVLDYIRAHRSQIEQAMAGSGATKHVPAERDEPAAGGDQQQVHQRCRTTLSFD